MPNEKLRPKCRGTLEAEAKGVAIIVACDCYSPVSTQGLAAAIKRSEAVCEFYELICVTAQLRRPGQVPSEFVLNFAQGIPTITKA